MKHSLHSFPRKRESSISQKLGPRIRGDELIKSASVIYAFAFSAFSAFSASSVAALTQKPR